MASIHRLAGRGDPFELLAALDAGADPNDASGKDGHTPLMHAAKADNRVAARLLLKRGADLDAVGTDGRTALLEAAELAMKRLLLDTGANPDLGRIQGMTPLAFYASFRTRNMVDLFLGYGANPDEMTQKGPSVRTMLEDPSTVWMPPFPLDSPEQRARNAQAILKLSDGLRLTPEGFVSEHRHILIWSFGSYPYDDPALAAWASRVSNLLASPESLETAYRAHLTGDTLAEALRSLVRPKQRAARDAERKRRAAEFEALHLDENP